MTIGLVPNRILKANYPKYTRNALVAAVVIHVLLFVLSPQFAFKPYEPKDSGPMTMIVPEEEYVIPPPPDDIPLPPNPPEPAVNGEEVDKLPDFDPSKYHNVRLQPRERDKPTAAFIPFDKPPVPIRLERPHYPDLAREAGLEGRVLVKILIDVDGKVTAAVVVESDVTRAMEEAALEAARKCRFIPAKQRTVPVKAYVTVPFHFRLRSGCRTATQAGLSG